MSMYYSPELVRLLAEERLREARLSNVMTCCQELGSARSKSTGRGPLRSMFSRQSPATCSC
jgi:hypothetical protein